MSTAAQPRPATTRASGDRTSARRRPRRVRHHRRPRQGDDLPLAVPAGGARAARLPDRRRGGRRLERRGAAQARARGDRSAPARRSTRTSSSGFADAPLLRQRRLRRPGRSTRGWQGHRRAREAPVFYLEIPPFLFGTVIKGLAEAGLTEQRARGRREAVRPRPRVRARAGRRAPPVHRRVPALPHRPLPGEDGRCDEFLYLRLRQHDARADLEPQPHRLRADHDGRELRRRGPRPLLRPGRRAARRGRQPPDAGRGRRGDGGARRRRRRHAQGRQVRGVPRDPRRPTPRTTSAASTTATSTSTASRRTRPPRPTPRSASTSTTGAGRACRSSSAPASTCRSTQTEVRLVFKHPPRLGFIRASAQRRPEPDQLVIKLDPTTGHAADARRPPRRQGGPAARSRSTWSSPRRAARRRPRTRCSCSPRCRAIDARFTRQDGVEESWRILQPLLDNPPPVHRTRRDRGGRPRPTELRRGHGRWHGPWVAS